MFFFVLVCIVEDMVDPSKMFTWNTFLHVCRLLTLFATCRITTHHHSVLNSYQAAAVAAGQYSAGISNISPHSTSRGPFLVDMRIFIDKIILPVSSEIARLH